MNKTIAIFSVAAAVTSTVITASASTFDISGSGNSFSVTRSGEGTNTAETVYYRAVGLTAYAGQHFIIPSGSSPAASVALAFGAGETNRLISVEERTPSATAYKFQTGTSRAYRLEVVDEGGFLLASCDRAMTAVIAFPEMLLDRYRDLVLEETGEPVNGLFLSASISARLPNTNGLKYLIVKATDGDIDDGGDEVVD